MKFLKIYFLLFMLLFVFEYVFCDEFDSIQNNINSQYQQQQRESELQARQKKVTGNKYIVSNKEKTEILTSQTNEKFKFNKIEILYNKYVPNIDTKSLDNIVKKYVDCEIDLITILKMQKAIEQYYLKKGYTFVNIYVDRYKIKDKILSFVVMDGYKENVVFKNGKNKKYSSLSNSLLSCSFYPFAKDFSKTEIEIKASRKIATKKKNIAYNKGKNKKRKTVKKFKFNKIEILYNKEVPCIYKRSLDNIVKIYVNQKIDLETISKMQKAIEQYYSKKGYAFARVYIDVYKIKDKILSFVVMEGYIEKIIFKNGKGKKYSKLSNSLASFSFYPFAKNSPINIKDIDQGLEQVNRLQSSNAVVELLPAKQNGYSIIQIINSTNKPININVGIDNSGSKNTGTFRQNYSLSIDNLFKLNDNINIGYSRTLPVDGKDKENNSLFANINIPFGYFLFMASFFDSDYNFQNRTYTGNYLSDGSTKNYNVAVETVVSRSQKHKISLGGELALKETETLFDYEKIDVSSQKLSILSVFTTLTYYFNNSSFYSKLSYDKGLDCFDATKNTQYMPIAQFSKLSLYAQYSHRFMVPLIKKWLFLCSYTNIQYSKDKLYSCEQISIGGQYSVRGFKEESVNGDTGGYINNTLTFNFADIFNTKKLSFLLPYMNINGFIDYGCIYSNNLVKAYQLAGSGVGLSYNIKYFNISASWSRQIFNDANLKDEKDVFYLSAQARIYF